MRCKSVTVVGLGPSLVGSGFGLQIDEQPIVVRTVIRKWDYDYVTTEDYGLKTTHAITTAAQCDLLRHEHPGVTSVWIYNTWKKINREKIEILKSFIDAEFEVINPYIQPYLDLYGENYCSDDKRLVPWPSKGTAGILTVILKLKPRNLYLLGFDLVRAGIYHIEKAEEHDWACEKAVILTAAKKNNTRLHWWGHEDNFSGFFDQTQDN